MSLAEDGGDGVFSSGAPDMRRTPLAFRNVLRVAAENWQGEALIIGLPTGRRLRLAGSWLDREVRLNIRDFRFIRRILASGDIGFAEGYISGDWDTPDLPALLTAFSANFDRLSLLMKGNPLVRAFGALAHALNGNSRIGARRNVHAHYDLGNDFYRAWLDASMTYSSALFSDGAATLEEAQAAKRSALLEALEVRPGDRLLEIGCGWGEFAMHAARERGAQVVAVTISKAQWELARRRVFEAGLAEAVEVRLQDYRDVEGLFDKVASIEMFEAVGEAYWPSYFGRVADVLAPAGRAGLQVITIDEALFDGYRRRPDFIQAYVFPGGMLPSETRLKAQTDKSGLVWTSVRRFGADYAETLSRWGERFEASWPEVEAQGFDDRFRRLWRYYLGYCEAGFRTRRTDVLQLVLGRA